MCESYFKVSGKKPNTELLNLISIQNIVISKEGRKYLNTKEPCKHTRSFKFLFDWTPTMPCCTLYICRWHFYFISLRPPKLFSRWKCMKALLHLDIWEGLTQVIGWSLAIKSSDYFALYVLVKRQDLYNKVLVFFFHVMEELLACYNVFLLEAKFWPHL